MTTSLAQLVATASILTWMAVGAVPVKGSLPFRVANLPRPPSGTRVNGHRPLPSRHLRPTFAQLVQRSLGVAPFLTAHRSACPSLRPRIRLRAVRCSQFLSDRRIMPTQLNARVLAHLHPQEIRTLTQLQLHRPHRHFRSIRLHIDTRCLDWPPSPSNT
jgi:hypothetical protein